MRKNLKWVAIPSFIQGISTLITLPFVPLILYGVAIPSFIQGISTRGRILHGVRIILSRNPFFYSGHFNFFQGKPYIQGGEVESQSLLLFRAFQLSIWQEGKKGEVKLSQSLLLFRAFQLYQLFCMGYL